MNNTMKNLLIKGKKTLAIISGILFGAILMNNFSNRVPINYAEASEANNIENLSISTSVDIEENIIVKGVVINETPQYTPDARKVENLRNYLAGRQAPLADYAEEFVKAADHYNIDYRIIAAISVIESGGGKHTFRPYNAWGWGRKSFTNWTEGIWTVSAGISEYYARGLTRPELIAPYYCPPNAVKWAQNINFVMNQIGN
jgi:hypothetical protein